VGEAEGVAVAGDAEEAAAVVEEVVGAGGGGEEEVFFGAVAGECEGGEADEEKGGEGEGSFAEHWGTGVPG
jgi:hypothetical protein